MSDISRKKNILLILGSPKNNKGNSKSLLDYLKSRIDTQHDVTMISLRKEINHPEVIMELVNQADIIVISYPIYQNSFPGLVLQLFDMLIENKNQLEHKERKLIAISNSGFPEKEANTTSIEHCRQFAKQIGFTWEYGIIVAPGTIIDGNDLTKAGKMYSKTREILDYTAQQINTDDFVRVDKSILSIKPIIHASIYRVMGRVMENKVIKQLGKEKYYQTPLI